MFCLQLIKRRLPNLGVGTPLSPTLFFFPFALPSRSQLISPALLPTFLLIVHGHLKLVGHSFYLNVLELKKFDFRVVLTAGLGDFYFKRGRRKKKNSSHKMFALEVTAPRLPEG